MSDSVQNSALAEEPYEDIMDVLGKTIDAEPQFIGNIEDCTDGVLSGWVKDAILESRRVNIKVYEHNCIVGEGLADIQREDLKESSIGDGKYGFSIKLDNSLLDGAKHDLSVVCGEEEVELGVLELESKILASSVITKISAGKIRGSIDIRSSNIEDEYEVEILVDGHVCTTGLCSRSDKAGSYNFAITLPTTLFDDCYHTYFARLSAFNTQSELFQDKIQSQITAWKHLAVSESALELSSVAKQSAHRYKALQEHIKKSKGERLEHIIQAHDVLVEGADDRKNYPRLVLPKFDNPEVSIIVPVHNMFSMTYHCIAALILAYNETSFELVLVDDCSSDITQNVEDYIENVKVIRNEKNMGFQYSSDIGTKKADGKYYLFLNNDTEVTNGWLDNLVMLFSTFNRVGVVGSKLIYPDGRLQEAGGIVWDSGKPGNVGHGKNAQDPSYNYVRQVDYLSGAALIIRKDVWHEVGGFSPEFAPAYYEDTDLAFKVREAGYRTLYSPSSLVIHYEGFSHGKSLNEGVKKNQAINAPKFRSKWRHDFRNNGAHGINLVCEKDRNVDFRVLMIDCTTPRPDQDAGSYAFTKEMGLLQELGCKVTFAPNNMAYMGKYTRELQDQGVECIYAPFYSDIGRFLKDRGNEFNLVYVTRYDVAEDVVPYVKKYSKAKIVLNNCDLHFLREMRAALIQTNVNLKDACTTRERELDVMQSVDAVLSYSEVEHSVIASHSVSQHKIFKCPWVLEKKYTNTPFSERNGIAFLGGFNHTPNKEAVHYFVDRVMPILRQEQPGIKFHIYGSKITDDIIALASEDIIVEGYVESLSQVFDNCKLLVAPLQSGAGVKGKVLESIAHGVPCVLSPLAIESTGLTHEYNTLVAEAPREWVDHILSVYNSEELWKSLVENCKHLVETTYSRENGLTQMSELMQFVELDPARHREPLFKV